MLLFALIFGIFSSAYSQQYNFSKGDSFTFSTTIDQLISQMMMGQQMEVTNLVESIETLEIMDVDNGVFTIKLTSTFNKTTVSSPQGTQTMSSDGNTTNDLAMKAVTGLSYSFKMDKSGQILEIMNLEDTRTQIREKLEGTSLAMVIPQILETYSEETQISNLDNKFNIYPETESTEWSKEKNLTLNSMPLSLTADYNLSGNEVIMDGDLTVSGKGTFNGMQLDMNLEGTQDGTFNIDPNNGAILTSESETLISGSVSAQGMTIPMSISFTTKLSMEKN